MSMFYETLVEIISVMLRSKWRLLLTCFGVFWAMFILMILLGVAKGLENGFSTSFTGTLTQEISVTGSSRSISFKGQQINQPVVFKLEHLEMVARDTEVESVSAEKERKERRLIKTAKKYGEFPVVGITENYFDIHSTLKMINGRPIKLSDHLESRKVVVIADRVKTRIFSRDENPIGKNIMIDGIVFTIIGVFVDSDKNVIMSERIYLPLSTYRNVFDNSNLISKLSFIPSPKSGNEKTKHRIINQIKKMSRVDPLDQRAIFVEDLSVRTKKTNHVFYYINSFIWVVVAGTLFAGVIGVSNVMNTSIKERTLELGLRKALGATSVNVVKIIGIEAVLVTGVSGLLGLLIGFMFINGVNLLMTLFAINLSYFNHPSVNPSVAFVCLIVLIAAGLISGFSPALKATRISPIAAMRAKG